jgi:hypothetical protein
MVDISWLLVYNLSTDAQTARDNDCARIALHDVPDHLRRSGEHRDRRARNQT